MKYSKFLFLITILLNSPLKAQDYDIQWTKGPNLPIRLSETRAIACNDKVYVIGGKITHDNSDLNDNENVAFIFEYNPENETWSRKADMHSKQYDVALAVIGNKIYAIGSETEVYDTKTNAWQRLKPLPGGMAHLEAAVVNRKIYVFGCEEGSYSKTMMYDPKNDKWTEKSPIPTPRLAPNVAVIDEKIYVMGGIGFNENNQLAKFLQTIEIYNPQNDSWKSKNLMPQSFWGAEGTIVKDDNIFLINIRSTENQYKYNVYICNPKTDKWFTGTNLPKSYREHGVALLKNKIYVIGGHDETFTQYSDVFIGKFPRKDK